MAKISRHGGPTYTGVQETSDAAFLDSLVEQATGDEIGEVSRYEGMLRAELQAELADRGLPTSGNKVEMIARLVEHDTTKESDMSEPEETAAAEAEATEEPAAEAAAEPETSDEPTAEAAAEEVATEE